MRVGFAGLGRMGSLMARNIAASGAELSVWNRTASKAHAFAVEHGCEAAETPRALADAADVVVTMLADDEASSEVHHGPDGLLAASRCGTFIEMGTVSPDHIAALGDTAGPSVCVIDAPVSGATQAADAAQLLIMAGCTEDEAAPFATLFGAMGKKTICLGALGAGAVMKLAVNSLIHGMNQTLAEALVLSEAAGIAPGAAFDVIEASAAAAPMFSYRRPLYLDEAGHDVSFTVALARKDMQLAGDLARALGTRMPQGDVTLDLLGDAERHGYAARDLAAMLDYMRKGS